MTATTLRAALARLAAWALIRAGERSTWIGLGSAAVALGYSTLGKHLTGLGDIVPMILGVGGAGLAAASTSPLPDAAAGQAGSDRPAA